MHGANWTMPTRLGAAWLRLRVWRRVALRAWRDLRAARVERHRAGDALADAGVVAERRSALWRDGREDEFRLVAGEPGPRCGTTIEAVFFSEHQMNYCPEEQTEGRVLKDRRLSRLLK